MPYSSPADLIARKDPVLLGQLVSDDPDSIVSPEDLPTDPNLNIALGDASGTVDSACLVAQRYLPTDLAGLEGNSAFLLSRLVCDLAFTYLRRRRGYDGEDLEEFKQANETLDRLRKGELVFGDVAAVVDAGNVVVDVLNAQIQARQGLVSSIASQRFLPSRPYPRS